MRFDGHLRSWSDERGFGFIAPVQGEQEIFVHVKAFRRREGRPQVGHALSFDVELGPDGRKRAARAAPRRGASARPGAAALFAIPVFVVLFAAVSLGWRPPAAVGLLYLGASAVVFVAYALDKAAAERGGWRMPERSLHLLALVGGWPGAPLAQHGLRHKTSKPGFRAVFWGTVVVNVVAFVVASSPMGRALWSVS